MSSPADCTDCCCFCCICFSICGHTPLVNLCTYIPSKWCGCKCGQKEEDEHYEPEVQMDADHTREAELFREQPQTRAGMDPNAKYRDKSAIN